MHLKTAMGQCVVGNRVCTTLDTAKKNRAEADSLLRLQVDSRVAKHPNGA